MTELGFDLGWPTPGPGPFPYPTRPCLGCPPLLWPHWMPPSPGLLLPLLHGAFAQPVPFPTPLSQLSSLEGRA